MRNKLIPILCGMALAAVPAAAQAAPELDPAFGNGGSVTPRALTDVRGFQGAWATSLHADGKIVLPMELSRRVQARIKLGQPVIRLRTDGARDMSYGSEGVGWISVQRERAIQPWGVEPLADGGDLVTGHLLAKSGLTNKLFVARISASGRQWRRFGVRGAWTKKVYRSDGTSARVADVRELPDGDILLAIDREYVAGHTELQLHRITAGGKPVLSWGVRGCVRIKFDDLDDIGGVELGESDVVLTTIAPFGTGAVGQLSKLRRYRLDGTPDPAFGVGGVALPPAVPQAPFGELIRLGLVRRASDGGVLVGGLFFGTGGDYGLVVRYRADGSLDSTFGAGGVLGVESPHFVRGFDERPDGSVLVAYSGYSDATKYSLYFKLFRRDGTVDTSFGNGGRLDFANRQGGSFTVGNGPTGRWTLVNTYRPAKRQNAWATSTPLLRFVN